MLRPTYLLTGAALAAVVVTSAPAFAQTQSVTAEQAMAALHAVLDYASKDGTNPSIAVLDSDGNVVLLLRGNNASPHNIGLAERKAYTANMFKMPTIEWRDKTKPGQPDADQRKQPKVIPLGGGYPIKVGNTVIGGVGVSGTRGGQEGDTAAAKAGADAAAAKVSLKTAQR
jgi:uncharacterized protein GlcG (DUF336 family)